MLLYPVVPVEIWLYIQVSSLQYSSPGLSLCARLKPLKRASRFFVTAQKNNFIDGVSQEDLFKVGTLCKILQNVRLPDGTVKVVLEGGWRCKALHYVSGENFLEAKA